MPNMGHKMKNIQEIFNAVIDAGFYAKTEGFEFGGYRKESRFMCCSLDMARKDGVISYVEFSHACAELDHYLNGNYVLSELLESKGLPYDFDSRLFIYRNWESRPL